MSPNAHSPLKHCFAVQIPEVLYRKIEKLAEADGITVTEEINRILRAAASQVELTAEDEEIIDERVAHRILIRKAKREGK